jgi:hypothetical protein
MALETALINTQMQQQQGQMPLPGLPMAMPGSLMMLMPSGYKLQPAPPQMPTPLASPPLALQPPSQPASPGGGTRVDAQAQPPMVLPAPLLPGGHVPSPLPIDGGGSLPSKALQPAPLPAGPHAIGGGSGGGAAAGSSPFYVAATARPAAQQAPFHEQQQHRHQQQQQQQQHFEGVGSDGVSGTPAAPTPSEVARARGVLGSRIASLQAFVAEHQLRELHMSGQALSKGGSTQPCVHVHTTSGPPMIAVHAGRTLTPAKAGPWRHVGRAPRWGRRPQAIHHAPSLALPRPLPPPHRRAAHAPSGF